MKRKKTILPKTILSIIAMLFFTFASSNINAQTFVNQNPDTVFWQRMILSNQKPDFKPTNKKPANIGWSVFTPDSIYTWIPKTQKWVADSTSRFHGQKGDKGDIGATGPQGPAGNDGAVGATGPQGVSGLPGATGIQGIAGPQGIKGDVGATGATGATGPAGPAGPAGPQGIPGTAGGSKGYIDPDDFGALHQDKTFAQAGISQTTINTNYPGFGFTTATKVDAAAWSMSLKQAGLTGKMIIAYGRYEFGTDSAIFPYSFRVIRITGDALISVIGTNGAPVFTRKKPTDNSDANIMIQAHVVIDGLQISCLTGQTANRIGIDIGPTYNSVYRKCDTYSLAEGIHLRFALNTEVDMCESYCTKGFISDIGNWPGASNSNSQSNHTTYNHCRFYALNNADVAFGVYACSGNIITNCIIEGDRVRVGIDYDAKGSTVVKGITIHNTHFECVNGATDAFIKLRMAAGLAVIDNVFGQYPAVMVNASASAGYPHIEVSHIAWWVPSTTGKFFVNGGCNWAFNYNDNFSSNPADFGGMFTGTIPTFCSVIGPGCGGNKYTALMTGR